MTSAKPGFTENQETQTRLQEIKDKLPWVRVAYQERVAFDYYRQALERVISRSEAALEGSSQRAGRKRSLEQHRALLRTATVFAADAGTVTSCAFL